MNKNTIYIIFLKHDLRKLVQLRSFFDLKSDVLFIIPGEKQPGKSSPDIRTH